MKAIKVKEVREHKVPTSGIDFVGKDLYRSVLVAPAKLVLVECKTYEESLLFQPIGKSNYILTNGICVKEVGDYLKPIHISETEKIEKGDWYYDIETKTIKQAGSLFTNDDVSVLGKRRYFKILALPEHLSPELLQMIVDGKGKEVLIECGELNTTISEIKNSGFTHFIKLNSSNHITVYPVEERMVPVSIVEKAFDAGRNADEWDQVMGWIPKYSFKQWFEQTMK